MRKLDKILSYIVLSTVTFSLTLFFALSAHIVLVHNTLTTILSLVVYFGINVFVLVTFFLKAERTKEAIYDFIFSLVFIASGYFFITGRASIFALVQSSRMALPFFTIFFIVIYFLTYIVVLVNYIVKIRIISVFDREIKFNFNIFKRQNENTALAREARIARIEATFAPLYFYLVITAVVAFLFFGYTLVTEYFTIPLGGDFTQQQIPFYTNGYDDWWNFFKTGQFPLWDSNTFLGASNVGSNSFYYAMNPFFLPILLFPRALIPQGISVLMIIKFTLAAYTMRTFLKYLKVSERNARIFGLVYAFAGWNVYYLWFNHFMEVAVVFPLIFLGIEKTLKEKKIKTLIFALALMGFANYFFLVTAAVLGVLYAGFRYFQLFPQIKGMDKLSVIGLGVIAFALGILASSVVLFPSLAIALNSDRVTDATYLDELRAAFNLKNYKEAWEIISKWEHQNVNYTHKKLYPLISFYFPVLSNRSSPLLATSSYDNTISSVFVFSPVILLFIPALVVSIKQKKFSHLLAVALFLFALFTPFFYNALHGFSKEYGRWQLIVVFSLIAYIATSFEDIKQLKAPIFDLSFLINLILMAVAVKQAYTFENSIYFGELEYRELIIYYQFIMLFVAYISFRFLYQTRYEHYARSIQIALEVVVMGSITMIGHGTISYKNSVNGGLSGYNEDVKVINAIKNQDDSFYRIYNTRAVKGHDNLPMRENYNGLSAFHSLYNFELMTFNEWSRVNYNYNGWSLGIHERRSLLYDFLSVNYYVINDDNHVIKWTNGGRAYAPYKNVPNTYSFMEEVSTDTRFVYRKNDDARFSLGFGVDYALTYEQMSNGEMTNVIKSRGRFASVEFEELYLNTALLNYDDHETITGKYPHLATETLATYPRKHYSFYGAASPTLKRTVWEFTSNRYPYEANAENKNKPLPTPEYINENAHRLLSPPSKISGSKHAIEYEFFNGMPLLNDENGGEIIINLPLSVATHTSHRYNIFLYDENYNLITFDNHTNVSSSSTTWKVMRAMHSPKKVQKITLIPIGQNQTFPSESGVYVYTETTLQALRANAINNSLTNVKIFTNKLNFTTNYTNEKVVVTTIPYDPGWEVVTEAGEQLQTYKVQGGFVGFVSKKGLTNYTMKFMPEHFQIGLLASSSVFLLVAIAELVVLLIKYRKKYV